MSTYSKVALAVDSVDWEEVKPYVEPILWSANVLQQVSPDNTYICVYWDYIVWEGQIHRDILKKIENMRHAFIQITEEGEIWQDIETCDDRGCDEEFYQMLSWHADICFWEEGWTLLPSGDCLQISQERLFDILKAYVSNDAEATEPSYVYDALTFAGCEPEEIEALGFGYVIPEEE